MAISGWRLFCIYLLVLIYLFILTTPSIKKYYERTANVIGAPPAATDTPDWIRHVVRRRLPMDRKKFQCENFFKIGDRDAYVDCNTICDTNDGLYVYDYVYYNRHTAPTDDNNYDNGTDGDSAAPAGAYCRLADIARFNTTICDVILTAIDPAGVGDDANPAPSTPQPAAHGPRPRPAAYQCIPKYPGVFGGPHGNAILACGGRLRDNVRRQTYVGFLPLTVTVTDIDETDGRGRFRFECAPPPDGDAGAALIPRQRSSRFDLIPNPCARLLPAGAASEHVLPDWISGTCRCDPPEEPFAYANLFADPTLPCISCKSGYATDVSDSPGHQRGVTISTPCIDSMTPRHLWGLILLPCSGETLRRRAKCEKAVMLASVSYSPLALENMYDFPAMPSASPPSLDGK